MAATKKSKTPKPSTRYPKAVKQLVLDAYLSRQYGSLAEALKAVSERCIASCGRSPNLETAQGWSAHDGWTEKRKKVDADAEKSSRQKLLDYAAEIGFEAHKEALETVRDMLTASKVEIIRDKAAQDGDAKGFTEINPDYTARDKAIGHLAKMFELYGSEKVQHSGEIVTEIQVNWQPSKPHGDE